jgi:hypothetical protein
MGSYNVMNCTFAFQCHRTWRSLERTPFSNIRFCTECKKEVFRCTTQDQIDWVVENGFCGAAHLGREELLGVMSPPVEIELLDELKPIKL